MFGHLLGWYTRSVLYKHFLGLLSPNRILTGAKFNGILPGAKFSGILPCAKFTLCLSLAVLLHSTEAVGISQTSQRSTADATYIRQDGHHVGHQPTF